jgi:hypothetical protein
MSVQRKILEFKVPFLSLEACQKLGAIFGNQVHNIRTYVRSSSSEADFQSSIISVISVLAFHVHNQVFI